MTGRNKQERVQTEIAYQTFSEFLQSTPPNQSRRISNLSVSRQAGSYGNVGREINTPKLKLHCSDDLCKGIDSSYDQITKASYDYRNRYVYPYLESRGFEIIRCQGRTARRIYVESEICRKDIVYVTGSISRPEMGR